MKRERFLCLKCGIDKGFLITKKVKGISPQDRPCKICRNQKRFHHKYGRKNNTKTQFEEFIIKEGKCQTI